MRIYNPKVEPKEVNAQINFRGQKEAEFMIAAIAVGINRDGEHSPIRQSYQPMTLTQSVDMAIDLLNWCNDASNNANIRIPAKKGEDAPRLTGNETTRILNYLEEGYYFRKGGISSSNQKDIAGMQIFAYFYTTDKNAKNMFFVDREYIIELAIQIRIENACLVERNSVLADVAKRDEYREKVSEIEKNLEPAQYTSRNDFVFKKAFDENTSV